jgi:pimeloyl-ACP methyl ester carboxylesterase
MRARFFRLKLAGGNERKDPVMTQTQLQSSARSSARQKLLAGLPLTERRVRAGGISTAVLEGGQGREVVFLHGPAANATHWNRVVLGLTHRHRVIVPDLPGHGASEVSGGRLDVAGVTRWLSELLERTCKSTPVLVGQLMGGAIAARFAIAHGDRLEALVLIDTFGLVDLQPAPDFARAVETFTRTPTPENHDELWRYCARDASRLRQNMGELWPAFESYNIERARSGAQQEAMAKLMSWFGVNAIPAADLASIRVPTTLIWGRHDLATPVRVAEEASARFGWPLHVIEDANDDPPVEQPEAVRAALLATIDARAA